MLSQQELVAEATRIAAARATPQMTPEDKDELLENVMMSLLDRKVAEPFFSRVAHLATGGPKAFGSGKYLMHDEPRLPEMPKAPTLVDFFTRRILLNRRGGAHLLQSAKLATKIGRAHV